MQRFRIEFAKKDALRYTGNLDMQKVWERYLRRAGLPVAYSQGFHPQPKIQQACPLPLGFFSEAEIVDIWLDDDRITAPMVQQILIATGQPGIEIRSVLLVLLHSPAMQSIVASTVYKIDLGDSIPSEKIQKSVNRVLSSSSLIRERRNKTYDLRPLIESLNIQIDETNQQTSLTLRLAAREGATGRPEEVLVELGINPALARITRSELIFAESTPIGAVD